MIFDNNSEIFLSNLHKNLCCGCSLESLGEAILMSTHNISFYEEIAKLSLNYHQKSSNTHLISSAEKGSSTYKYSN